MSSNRMSLQQKQLAKELYKAHFTAKESSVFFGTSYATMQGLYRGFNLAKVNKHNRINLLPQHLLSTPLRTQLFNSELKTNHS